MKIEKLTDNKIRIILRFSELPNKDNFNTFISSDINTNKFFLDILNKAEKDFGFKTDNCKLLIEAYSSVEDFFIMTITKYLPKKQKIKLKLNKHETKLSSYPIIFEFNSFEEYCLLCEFLKNEKIPIDNIASKISLYLYNNTYYLIFHKLNLTYLHFGKLFSSISEFATAVKNSKSLDAKIMEYGKGIAKSNAFKTGIKYFVKK